MISAVVAIVDNEQITYHIGTIYDIRYAINAVTSLYLHRESIKADEVHESLG